MSQYTTTIRNYLMSVWNNSEINPYDADPEALIYNGINHVFRNDMPFYNTSADDKLLFQRLFLRKFYLEEIGYETFPLFRFALHTRLMERMPYYVELYKSLALEYDPLTTYKLNRDINVTEDITRNKDDHDKITQTINGNTTYTTNNTTTNNLQNTDNVQNLRSDTPQTNTTSIDYASEITRGETISTDTGTVKNDGSTDISRDSSDTTDKTFTGLETEIATKKNIETVSGYTNMDVSTLIMKYREAIVNINELLCNDLRILFMGVW